jgi:hypothetical protein
VNAPAKFNIRLEEHCLENYAAPPEDPLGELSHFEIELRRFCFECNRQVSIEIGEERIIVFLDPDICMILEDGLPEQVSELSQGKKIEIDFVESCCLIAELVPCVNAISCTLKEFGYSSPKHFTLNYTKKHIELDKTQVLGVLRRFLDEVMQLAVDGGYITQEEKDEFLSPAFPANPQPTSMKQGSGV